MKKISFFIAGVLLSNLYGHCQQRLSVGDSVPAILIPITFSRASLNEKLFTDTSSELLLLDFWNSNCGSCIALFPHLDSLQRQFSKQLRIVLVNTKSQRVGDDSIKISKILQKVRARTGAPVALPVVYNNTLLDQYFPCQVIPHEVWIYHGKVVAITSAAEVTANNIALILSGQPVHLQTKTDNFDFDFTVPLFSGGNGGSGREIKYRSFFSSYVSGVPTMSGSHMQDTIRLGKYAYNFSLYDLVLNAFGDQFLFPRNRVAVASTNLNFRADPMDQQRYDHLYCYDLITPGLSEAAANGIFREDLHRYFGITVDTITQIRPCLVLTAFRKLPVATKDSTDHDLEPETLHKYIRGATPERMVMLLNLYSPIPVINEVSAAIPLSVALPKDLTDVPALTRAFARCGLQLTVVQRPLTITVIADGTATSP